MPDHNDTAEPPSVPPHSAKRRASRRPALPALCGAAVLILGLAVLYGMAPAGKEGAIACEGAQATTARLDPLIQGEVAAFGLGRPATLAPDLTFEGPDARSTTLASLKGKILLVNFWATWCVPCRKEMPSLDALQGREGNKDFEVVAVNVDTARLDAPKTFLRNAGVTNLAYYADPSAEVLQVLKLRGELLGLPTTLLIDKAGCELGRIAGPADWASPEAARLVAAAKG